MKVLFGIVFSTMFIFLTYTASSQGCSDAGFCTMGAMRPNQSYNKKLRFKLRSIEYNFYRGKSLESATIYAHTLEFNASLGDRYNIHAKLPYMQIQGNLGRNEGLGDISLSITRNIFQKEKWGMDATIGVKIPTNNANATIQNEATRNIAVPAHMYYQTSLGSQDLIGGMAWVHKNWMFATGFQLPLTQNENAFRWSGFSEYPDQEYLQRHDVGIELMRGADIMLRVERRFVFTNFDISLGLLPIYRVTKDEVYNPDLDRRVQLEGTTGMALTGLASLGYRFDVNNGVRLIYGRKITVREVNPDGLSRLNVVSMSYIYQF